MKAAAGLLAWACVAAVVLYAAVGSEHGVAFQSHGAAACLGVIGLGLCLDARRRIRKRAAKCD